MSLVFGLKSRSRSSRWPLVLVFGSADFDIREYQSDITRNLSGWSSLRGGFFFSSPETLSYDRNLDGMSRLVIT